MEPHPSPVTPLCLPHDMLVYPLEPFKLCSFLSRRGLLMSGPNLTLLTYFMQKASLTLFAHKELPTMITAQETIQFCKFTEGNYCLMIRT